jgi:hypothetical protein
MEKLEFDVGLVEYAIGGGGVIRFHPADPSLYGRFVEAEEQLSAIEAELIQKGKTADPQALLALMREADTKAKALLNQVFGEGNDFHKALGGVSLLAVCADGKTVAEKLFAALGSVLEQGAQRLVENKLNALRTQQ